MLEEHSNELVQYVHDIKKTMGDVSDNLSVMGHLEELERIGDMLSNIDDSLATLAAVAKKWAEGAWGLTWRK